MICILETIAGKTTRTAFKNGSRELVPNGVDSVFVFARRRATGLEHPLEPSVCQQDARNKLMNSYLCHFELSSSNSFPVRDGEVGRQRWMAHDGRERISVLVSRPVTTGVHMSDAFSVTSVATHNLVKSACPW
jgi:hypothetical protein